MKKAKLKIKFISTPHTIKTVNFVGHVIVIENYYIQTSNRNEFKFNHVS